MQYGPLFRIECVHAYFGGVCRSLTVTPTDDCRRLMGRYQMLFRGVAGGGAVYCPQQTPPDLLKQFDETAAFTFALISTDSALNSYTEIDAQQLDISETIFHFDNRKDYSEQVLGRSRQLLHEAGNPFAQGPLIVRAKTSGIPWQTGSDEFRILQPVSNQVVSKGVFAMKGAPAHLDLRGVPEGLYLLQVGDEPPRPFYLSDELPARRWGVISIYAGGVRQADELPDPCRVIDSDGVTHARTFTISLESRKTLWRYYIIPSRDQQNFGEYQVVNTGKKSSEGNALSGIAPQFKLLPGTTQIDGRAAWVYESITALPFLLSPANLFALSLRPNRNGQSAQRSIRLPYAQPVSLTKNMSEPGKMCSEMFVYV